MTTTRTTARPTNCTECSVRLTPNNRSSRVHGSDYDDVCTRCYDYWGWENTHADEDHDSLAADAEEREGCMVCAKDVKDDVAAPAPVATGRRNRSHAACSHPRTPAGRAACRKAAKTS